MENKPLNTNPHKFSSNQHEFIPTPQNRPDGTVGTDGGGSGFRPTGNPGLQLGRGGSIREDSALIRVNSCKKDLFNYCIGSFQFLVCAFILSSLFCLLFSGFKCFAQEKDLEFNVDVNANTVNLPKIFKPNIDLSGCGSHLDASFPQTLSHQEVLETWQKDIGFGGLYRVQFNLWEVSQLDKEKDTQARLLENYEAIMKKVTDAGGTLIVNIFGTPVGSGKVLDKRSPPRSLREFKDLIKNRIRYFSYTKRYNIWYELWSAPDLDDFFLGRKQEYLSLYRVVAEAINELEIETKLQIPLGGPSVSWWFQDIDGNTIITAERSLIYDLIKFCYRYKLPLDFITWHAYSTDPKAEKELTRYNKNPVELVRDWLSYFNFDRNIPLIVDEWNFDSGANYAPERREASFIAASYIPSRLKYMYEAGLDYQTYFCLEDFQDNQEHVVRNVGVFSYDADAPQYKGEPKSIYTVFRMLAQLGPQMFVAGSKQQADEFVRMIATKNTESLGILFYNYIDPEIAKNYLSRNIVTLKGGARKLLLRLISSNRWEKLLHRQLPLASARLPKKAKALVGKALESDELAKEHLSKERVVRVNLKNLKGNYIYERYTVDSSCLSNCEFVPVETKELEVNGAAQETLSLAPYSVNLIVIKPKPPQPPKPPEEILPETSQERTSTEAQVTQEALRPDATEKKSE